MKRLMIPILICLLVLSGCAAQSTGKEDGKMEKGSYTQIDQETAKEMMLRDDGHVIVDVRQQDEYDAGHIPGAILIPNESIGTKRPEQLPNLDQIILVYAEATPVGLFICRRSDNASLRIRLDYSIPKFRDCSVGQFLYGELAAEGIRELTIGEFTQDHESYLKKAGFTLRGSEYVKTLN